MASAKKSSKMSQIQLYGSNKSTCGYCHQKPLECSESYGIVSNNMSVDDYQALMLLGWRRSGTYFYKPTMHKTCCPAYTIRLKASEFKPSKSQKKVFKTVENFLTQPISSPTNNTDVNSAIGQPTSNLTITTEPSSLSDEKYELYKKYQMVIHGDPPDKLTPKGFSRFLVETPLFDPRVSVTSITTTHTVNTVNTIPSKYGSYHQLYRLNEQLIGVGVIDILPCGVSSVYFFYDPEFKHLVLGKYSVLKEIEFCNQIQACNIALNQVIYNKSSVNEQQNKVQKVETPEKEQYYFMGYYIHECEKMKYKGDYRPSQLLCPTSFEWVAFDEAVKILDRFSFSPLRSDLAEQRALLGGEKVKSTNTATSKDTNTGSNVLSTDKTSDIVDSRDERNTVTATNASTAENIEFTPFLPRIPNTSHVTPNDLKLDLGVLNQYFNLNQLTSEGVTSLTPLLREWIDLSGDEVCRRIVLCFN